MQIVSTTYQTKAKADIRPISWSVLMSFEKNYLDTVEWFRIGLSSIGYTDMIKPDNSDVIQEWNKYTYTDYTSRVLGIEWSRTMDPFSSVVLAMAEVTFNNYDNFFTPDGGSGIADFVLPYRPIRILAGFGGETVSVFIGITEKMPIIDEQNKTVTFHCIDFIYSLFDRPLDESVMFENKRTDEILSSLLTFVGIESGQIVLDTGYNTVPFAYFERGDKFKTAVNKLMEAEQGRFYLDETGTIRFKNRLNIDDTVKYDFTAQTNVISAKTRREDDIINVVEVKSKIREDQAVTTPWRLGSSVLVPANGSVDIWADFTDPVTNVDTPLYVSSATTSLFEVNTQADGAGSADSTHVTLDSYYQFGTAYKMTFVNSLGTNLYITNIELYYDAAVVVQNIYVREQSDSSVAKYDYRVYTINNDFIPTVDEATERALTIISDNAEYGGIQEIEVKGTPALQIDDVVSLELYDVYGLFRVTKITGKVANNQFIQILQLKKFIPLIS